MADHYRIVHSVVRIASENPRFAEFSAAMLRSHAFNPKSSRADVDVRFLSYDTVLANLRPGRRQARGPTTRGADQPGRGIRMDSGVWLEPDRELRMARLGWDIRLKIDGLPSTLKVSARFRERPDHTLRSLTNRDIRTNNLQQILRRVVLHPVFLLEERLHGLLPLHAGVITDGRRGLVLAGLSGVGKSTLSLYACTRPEWRLVTDNYALFDENQIHGIREPIRIGSRSMRLLAPYAVQRILSPIEYRFGGRTAYAADAVQADCCTPTDILLVRLGRDFELKEVEPSPMADALIRLNNFLGEFHIHDYADLIGLGTDEIAGRRVERYRRLTQNTRNYMLTVSDSESLETTFHRIAHALELS